ncbi:hypothetical protein ERJ75_000640500 [Trypanosoma vivax]|nr:hypothetical protein ERJ75_000640500 [Trypanosoma vivax]
MTQLALALACLLAGTLVSTRRGSAAPEAAGANIGAASILCEAALQADAITAQARALPCEAVKKKLEDTLNSVPAEVWAHALSRTGRLGKRTMNMVGNWTRGNTLTEFCERAGQGTHARVCSAIKALDTCTAKKEEAGRKVTEAVEPNVAQEETRWWRQNEQQSREEVNASHLCLGATMVYLCTGAKNKNPCFSKGTGRRRTQGRKRTHRSRRRGGSRRNLAESKESAVHGKKNGHKYQENARTLLGTSTRQERWDRNAPYVRRMYRLCRDHN